MLKFKKLHSSEPAIDSSTENNNSDSIFYYVLFSLAKQKKNVRKFIL